MYISAALIKNFRSVEHIEIDFTLGLNVLVGKNNAGKSNIIHALDYILGERNPAYKNYDDKDFYRDDTQTPEYVSDYFLVVVRLEGREMNLNLLSELDRKVCVTRLPNADDLFKNYAKTLKHMDEATSNYDNKTWLTYNQLGERLVDAKSILICLYVPRIATKSERSLSIFFKIDNVTVFVDAFANELRNALLTTMYIPSFRDPDYQLRVNQYSWYGKLIRSLYDQRNEKQKTELKKAQDKIAELLATIFQETTDNLRTTLAEAIFHHQVSFRSGANTKDDEHKQIMLYIDDGIDAPFYEKGSGIQSALIIALFTYYCQKFHTGSSLLLAEEPEIYLHPQARRAIEGQLTKFTEDYVAPQSSRQVIMSTHAPEFLRTASLDSIICVKKPPNIATTFIKRAKVKDENILRRWRQILSTKSAEMLFADHVILVEGGEEHIIPALSDLYFKRKRALDAANISVIRVNGKSQFRVYVSVLDEFAIGYTILTDFDFLKDEINNFSHILDAETQESYTFVKNMITTKVGSNIRGKDVKKAFNSSNHDWVQFYNIVSQSVELLTNDRFPTQDEKDKILAAWELLKERVEKQNINELFTQSHEIEKLSALMSDLRRKGIFVIPNGDLEDLLTPESIELSSSKDRRAIEVGTMLYECSSLDDSNRWIDFEIFGKLFEYIEKQIHILGHIRNNLQNDEI